MYSIIKNLLHDSLPRLDVLRGGRRADLLCVESLGQKVVIMGSLK